MAIDRKSLFEKKAQILVVDDNQQNIDLLEAYLISVGYEVLSAVNGKDALEQVATSDIDLIILDIMMPGIDGYEVCTRLKADDNTRLIPIIMLTALNALDDKIRGIECGADDFLNKPVNRVELLARVRSLVDNKKLNENLINTRNVIFTLSLAVEAHVPFARGHSERVSHLIEKFSIKLGFDKAFSDSLKEAAILHDLGKIGISRTILHKPEILTADEFTEIKKHPEIGEKICLPLNFSDIKLPAIRHHHERYDGSGYPDGLKRSDIPLGARIMSITDAFDAMISDRPYRKAMPVRDALCILEDEAGKQWDKDLVNIFVKLVSSKDIGVVENLKQ